MSSPSESESLDDDDELEDESDLSDLSSPWRRAFFAGFLSSPSESLDDESEEESSESDSSAWAPSRSSISWSSGKNSPSVWRRAFFFPPALESESLSELLESELSSPDLSSPDLSSPDLSSPFWRSAFFFGALSSAESESLLDEDEEESEASLASGAWTNSLFSVKVSMAETSLSWTRPRRHATASVYFILNSVN